MRPDCKSLIKAIDRYLAKADNDLEDELDEEGYEEPHKTVEYMNRMEDDLTESLEAETAAIASGLEETDDVKDFADRVWPRIKDEDRTNESIADIFSTLMNEFMPVCVESYIQSTDRELHCDRMSKRSMAWIDEWAEELGNIMRLNSHNEIQDILDTGIQDGVGMEEITRRILESGIRDERYKARRVAVTEILTAHRAAQQEAFMQSPSVEGKKWRHSGPRRIQPRPNHVAMDGATVRKSEPFQLAGADGGLYYPMYPGDTSLPPGERINCHCICQSVVNDSVLGMSLEERQRLQQQAIDEMDDNWERELSERNRARAGIETYPNYTDVSDEYSRTSRPGTGSVKQEAGYKRDRHEQEISMADYLHDTFGGDITLCAESTSVGVKTPDFMWGGKMWELKTLTTEKSANSAVRQAVKQISANPGGIILDYQDHDISVEEVLKATRSRLKRSGIKEADVLILTDNRSTKRIFRFRK